jgi:hypothetical protein
MFYYFYSRIRITQIVLSCKSNKYKSLDLNLLTNFGGQYSSSARHLSFFANNVTLLLKSSGSFFLFVRHSYIPWNISDLIKNIEKHIFDNGVNVNSSTATPLPESSIQRTAVITNIHGFCNLNIKIKYFYKVPALLKEYFGSDYFHKSLADDSAEGRFLSFNIRHIRCTFSVFQCGTITVIFKEASLINEIERCLNVIVFLIESLEDSYNNVCQN